MTLSPTPHELLSSYPEGHLRQGLVTPRSRFLTGSYLAFQMIAERDIEIDVPPPPDDILVVGFTPINVFGDLLGRKTCFAFGRQNVVYIPSGQPAWFRTESSDLLHIHIAPGGIEQMTERSNSSISRRALQGHSDPLIFTLGRMLRDASFGPHFASKLEIDAISILLANRLLSIFEVDRPRSSGGLAPWQVRRTTEYLHSHLDEDVSLATMAGLVNLSPFHFARAFKQSVGSPPHAYHCALRLEEAKRLLVETDHPITDIALAVGYDAPQTLARVFRREVGATPTAYRRERRHG